MSNFPDKLITPFALRKRFAVASFCSIVAIALVLSGLMSYILIDRMLQREGEVSMDFFQNLLRTDQSAQYFLAPDNEAIRARFLQSMRHIEVMNEPVRANAYQPDGTVLWSTDPLLVGKRFLVNDELQQALAGSLVVHSGRIGLRGSGKAEHAGLASKVGFYVESYIPIRMPGSDRVVGVMEVYKVPEALSVAIRESVALLWLAACLSAIGLFFTLDWIVARAEQIILRQQALLNETQSLAVAVELSSAVAHNLRNPLASIRSSAELMQSDPVSSPGVCEQCLDITQAVDRADRWIHDFLRVSRGTSLHAQAVFVSPLLRDVVAEFNSAIQSRRVVVLWSMDEQASVWAHPAALKQIAVSLIANSLEAIEPGGVLHFSMSNTHGFQVLGFEDNGPGIPEAVKSKLFQPFFSTKSGGLGIGLTLVKRFVEHWGGQVEVMSVQPRGTRIELRLKPGAVPVEV